MRQIINLCLHHVCEYGEIEDEGAESAPKKRKRVPAMGAPVAHYVVEMSAEAMCRAFVSDVAFLDARKKGIGLVKAASEEEYGPGFTTTLHPLQVLFQFCRINPFASYAEMTEFASASFI